MSHGDFVALKALAEKELGELIDGDKDELGVATMSHDGAVQSPRIKHTAGIIKFWWDAEQVQATATRIHQHKDGRVTCELKITTTAPGYPSHLHQSQINLVATRSKQDLAKHLETRRNDLDWGDLIEELSREVLDRIRQGEPVIVISTTDEVEPPTYLINPLIPEDEPTVIFGLGGSGKSTMALLFGMTIQLGWHDNPLGLQLSERKDVMYLDWETSYKRITYRMKSLQKGMALPYLSLHYRRCALPLADDTEAIQRAILDNNIGFVIIDSVGAACGGDLNNAEPAIRMFTALRELNVTSLLVAHTSKNPATKETTIFGSAYFNFYARSVWEMRKVQKEGEPKFTVGLYHRKVNDDGIAVPLGYEIKHDKATGSSYVRSCKIAHVEGLAGKTSIKDKARDALGREGRMTLKQLAMATAIRQDSLYAKLYEMKKEGSAQEKDGYWSLVYKE